MKSAMAAMALQRICSISSIAWASSAADPGIGFSDLLRVARYLPMPLALSSGLR
jgi:hypothetical protein